MKTTNQLLDAVKAARGLRSDYQLAKLLSWNLSRLGNYRAKRSVLDDSGALKIAALLGYDPGLVLTWIHAERALRLEQRDVFKVLEQFARKAAAGMLIAVGVSLAPSPATPAHAGGLCIMVNRARRSRLRRIAAGFARLIAAPPAAALA